MMELDSRTGVYVSLETETPEALCRTANATIEPSETLQGVATRRPGRDERPGSGRHTRCPAPARQCQDKAAIRGSRKVCHEGRAPAASPRSPVQRRTGRVRPLS